jgi:hypothetical protein
MKLSTINNLLRRIGLVLVIAVDDKRDGERQEPTRLWIERYRSYLRRCKTTEC